MPHKLKKTQEAVEVDGAFQEIAQATAEETDWPLDNSITAMLRLVREHLAMDVVFVAHYEGSLNVFTYVDSGGEGLEMTGFSQPRADSFCQRVLDGRLPKVIADVPKLRETHDLPEAPIPIGAYMAAPVRLQDGTLYGTLCCLSFEPIPSLNDRHYRRLGIAARQTARLIDEAAGRLTAVPST